MTYFSGASIVDLGQEIAMAGFSVIQLRRTDESLKRMPSKNLDKI